MEFPAKIRAGLIAGGIGLLMPSSPSLAATLVYSNDVLGEVEPCGCRVDPMGGVIRRSGVLRSLQKEKKGPFLQVDVGDFLFESDDFPPTLTEVRKIQAQTLVETHERMGLEATVPGEKDFALGLLVYKELLERTKIKALAANLRFDGKAPFSGSAIFEKTDSDGKKTRVGVVGLVGEGIHYPTGFSVEPRLPAYEKERAALEGKVDLIIVLSHSGMEADRELARKAKGITLIIGAHSQSFTQEPVIENRVPIVQSSYRGQYLGIIPLETLSHPDGFRLLGMDASYEKDTDPTIQALVTKMKKDIEKKKRKLVKAK